MTQETLIRRLQISCLGLDPIDPLRLLVDDVIEALREHAMYEVQRLGQEIEQEPVAWADIGTRDVDNDAGLSWTPGHFHTTPLYTHPPQRTWVGLTDEDQFNLVHAMNENDWDAVQMMDAIEAKLKEKNT